MADGCSVDRAYKILMQIVHNGFKAFYNGLQQEHFFLYFISLIRFVSLVPVEFVLCLKVVSSIDPIRACAEHRERIDA